MYEKMSSEQQNISQPRVNVYLQAIIVFLIDFYDYNFCYVLAVLHMFPDVVYFLLIFSDQLFAIMLCNLFFS